MATPNVTFTNLKNWLHQTLLWLHADGSPDVLEKPHQQLLQMMLTAKNENRTNEVWDLIDKLNQLATRAGETREQGEIYIKCAKMAADLENLKDALVLFRAAKSKYIGYPHQHAIVLWMMGCLRWVMRENVEAIILWQAAIASFKDRQVNVQVDSEKGKWYSEKLVVLEKALELAINTGVLPAYNLTVESETARPAGPKSAEPSSEPSFFEGDTLRWVSCQVSESVPAGGFGPTGFDPNPLGFLEISEILIEDEPYQVYSVRRLSARQNAVNISSQSQYQTVYVTGTSMNAASPIPIEEGDYVLVQVQPDFEDNEIVVAGIIGQDVRATVKRLRRRNGKIQLVPESTDPKNYEVDLEKEFSLLDDDFKILGTVIAIFKKKPC